MVKAVVADEARIKTFEDGVASSGAPRAQVTLPSSLLALFPLHLRPPPSWKRMLDLIGDSCVQVGLVVGKLSASSDRALVYSLLPTPPTDAGEPACSLRAAAPSAGKAKSKGGGKGGAASSSDAPPTLQFDVDWVAEHARQVRSPVITCYSAQTPDIT
jgi:hypothetical protein